MGERTWTHYGKQWEKPAWSKGGEKGGRDESGATNLPEGVGRG